MEILSRAGAGYRTRLMEAGPAERFARCLRGNAQYVGVQVRESRTAKGPRRWFVAYFPADDARYSRLLQGHREERAARAAAEGAGFVFCADPSGRFEWCLSRSGEVYEVTAHSCTCPDYHYRGAGSGVPCKHMLALRAGQGVRTAFRTTPDAETARRIAESDANVDNDFPDY